MSARDIIASCILGGSTFLHEDRLDMGDEALSALTSAGYRILAPGEMDRETLEAAAKVADRHAGENDAQIKKQMVRAAKIRSIGDPFGHGAMAEEWCAELTAAQHEAQSIAAAIRALGGGDG
ncbi:hypothetical protein [Nitratireductor rhodophyticola]|uniref:hypothetical protein n=1 Tax=Nitratireductor rhodophyticola TaxID=2854036 RepID=UPI003BAC4AC7